MRLAFGLDFGTTNSVLSVVRNGKVEVIDIDSLSSAVQTLKSVIFFDEEKDNKPTVGQAALDSYFEFGGSYGRLMQSIKSFLPSKNFSETYVFGKRFELEDLIGIILREIKHRGELYVGHVVDTVVLGRPVIFSSNKEEDLLAEERLRTAALRAGFSSIYFVYEPIAATLAYESTLKSGEEKLIFMGDFGGGTSDFVVMRLRGGIENPAEDRIQDILSVGGVYVGGDAFDSDIMSERIAPYFGKGAIYFSATQQPLDMPISIIKMLCRRHEFANLRDKKELRSIRMVKNTVAKESKIALENLETLVLNNLGHMLFRSVEQVKIDLSQSELATISFSEDGIIIEESITREEFESIVSIRLDEIRQCSDQTLKQAGVDHSDIDLVLLTGGTSFIPCVRNIFTQRFGEQKLKPINAFTSVAYGLGLYALRMR